MVKRKVMRTSAFKSGTIQACEGWGCIWFRTMPLNVAIALLPQKRVALRFDYTYHAMRCHRTVQECEF